MLHFDAEAFTGPKNVVPTFIYSTGFYQFVDWIVHCSVLFATGKKLNRNCRGGPARKACNFIRGSFKTPIIKISLELPVQNAPSEVGFSVVVSEICALVSSETLSFLMTKPTK